MRKSFKYDLSIVVHMNIFLINFDIDEGHHPVVISSNPFNLKLNDSFITFITIP